MISGFRTHDFDCRGRLFLGVAPLLLIAACGGGGNGVESTPTPQPNPTPTPTPTPNPPPPAPPTVNLLPGVRSTEPTIVTAIPGGPRLSIYDYMVPLTITAVGSSFSGDATTTNAGGSLFQMDGVPMLRLNNPAFTANYGGGRFYLRDGRDFNQHIEADLDYVRYGSWWVSREVSGVGYLEDNGTFVGGLETPVSAIPTSGTASYTGSTVGHYSQYSMCHCASFASVEGHVQLTVDFGSRALSGVMTDMRVFDDLAPPAVMNDISFSASLLSSQNWFSGSTTVSSNPGGPYALNSNAAGSIVGSFYGPTAQEVGAVWTLSDGVRRVIGSFGASAGH